MRPLARWLTGSLLGALLPEPERGTLERRFGGDPALVSFGIGLIEIVGGIGAIYDSAMSTLRPMADEIATAFWAEANRGTVTPEEASGLTLGGSMLWLFWLMRPTTWLLLSVLGVGLLRLAAFLSTRTAVAEPAGWLVVRLIGLVRGRLARARERTAFGDAEEPDEVEAADGGALLVFTPRRHEDWTEAATIEIGGHYFRTRDPVVVERAGRKSYRYNFTPAGEHDVIRRYVAYELPKTGVRWAAPAAAQPGESATR